MSKQTVNSRPDPPYSRKRLRLIALLALAATGIALNIWIARPFIPGLTWAFAFAVIANPLHGWISSHVKRPGLAAGLSVTTVALALVLPVTFLVWQIGQQAGEFAMIVQQYMESGQLQSQLARYPYVAEIWEGIQETFDIRQEAQRLVAFVQGTLIGWMGSAVSGVVQLLIALFALFYFFRDEDSVVRGVRSVMPMSRAETDQLFRDIRDATHATVYGTLVVASVQGFLGGLMFWFLGLHAPLIWGAAMGLLAIIPILGAFVIWFPAALLLATQGAWIKALILIAWGSIVVGLIDNLLYPILVGNRLRMHTLPVFIAIVGGLLTFGASGIVLGPVILAGTIAVMDILRRRTAYGRSAKQETTTRAA
jgi:predicted PurR-regulated permease PerM